MKTFIVLLHFICVFILQLKAEIPAVAFKEVTKNFKDYHYSPLMGRVALDSGLLYNLRFFGNFIPAYKKKETGETVREYVDDVPQDPMMELLLKLFPSSAGTLTSVSEAKSNFGKNATIQDVADMLTFAKKVRAIIEENPSLMRDPKSRFGLVKIYNQYSPLGNFRDIIIESIRLEYNPIRQKLMSSKNRNNKIHKEYMNEYGSNKEYVEDGAKLKKEYTKKQIDLFKNEEMTKLEDQQLYPKYTTEQIILGFFVHKFNQKEDIYLLMKELGNEFLIPQSLDGESSIIEDLWNRDNFPIYTHISDLDFIFFATYHDINSPIPYKAGKNPISNGNCPYVKYEDGKKILIKNEKGEYITFADCQETTIRQFMNIGFFDATRRLFVLRDEIDNPFLKDFYDKQSPKDADNGSPDIRGAWNLVVAGIEDVRYTKGMNELDDGYLNFIKVIRSVLNYKLKDPLPQNKDEVIKELEDLLLFMNPTFKSIQVDIPDFRETLNGFNYKTNDFYGNAKITITNKENQNFTFTLRQTKGHGDIQNPMYKLSASILGDSLPEHGLIDNRNLKKGLYFLIAQGELLDDNQKLNTVDSFVPEMKEHHVMMIDRILNSLTVRDQNNIEKYYSILGKIVQKGFMYKKATQKAIEGVNSKNVDLNYSALKLFGELVIKKQAIDEAILATSKMVRCRSAHVKSSTLNLFKNLVEKGYVINEALAAALDEMKIDYQYYEYVRDSIIDLFIEIFKKGIGFDEVIKEASNLIKYNSSNVYQREFAINIFRSLFEAGEGCKEATKVAIELMKNQNSQEDALTLFKALVEKRQAFDEASQAALLGIKSKNDYVRNKALKLFIALVEKGRAYDEAIQITSYGMESKNTNFKIYTLKLFKALVEKEKGFDKALKTAEGAIRLPDYLVKKNALNLFTALVEKEQGYNEALDAASQLIFDPKTNDQNYALNLFEELFKRSDKSTEAFRVARQILNDPKFSQPVKNKLQELLDKYEFFF